MAVTRYEFGYTDENGAPMLFGLHGVSEDVAKAVRGALKKVTTITDVTAARITENVEDVTAAP